jgi:SAM-dependent methyltransferase
MFKAFLKLPAIFSAIALAASAGLSQGTPSPMPTPTPVPLISPKLPPIPAPTPRRGNVPFVPTPPEVVDAMLKVAAVTKDDVIYDLGSGDGRIVIAAAKKYGAKGVGIDINAELVEKAKAAATAEGVADKVSFIEGDLFEQDLSKATVITLYLLPDVNMKLRPTLLKLKPGTRIVSHAFDMGDWKPEKTEVIEGRYVYFWKVPAATEGLDASNEM